MVDQAHLRRIRAAVRASGFFIQGVGPAHPIDPLYWYTIGLQRLPVPRPEVIVFGLDQHCAAEALHALHDRVRVDGPVRPGDVLTGLLPGGGDAPVRVDPVRPRWVEAYAGLVGPALNRYTRDVPMIQLVFPDSVGRWPDAPGADSRLLQDQPLLAEDPCWRAPIVHTAADDVFFTEQPGATTVAVPVLDPFSSADRYELLRAQPLAADRMQLLDVPWAADHVTSGDILQTTPAHGVPGVPADVPVMSAALTRGTTQARAFRLPPPGTPEQDMADLTDTMWELVEAGTICASTTRATLHVNAAQPDRFDVIVRPFVRDGLLVPIGLRSEPEALVVPPEHCPDCEALRQ